MKKFIKLFLKQGNSFMLNINQKGMDGYYGFKRSIMSENLKWKLQKELGVYDQVKKMVILEVYLLKIVEAW